MSASCRNTGFKTFTPLFESFIRFVKKLREIYEKKTNISLFSEHGVDVGSFGSRVTYACWYTRYTTQSRQRGPVPGHSFNFITKALWDVETLLVGLIPSLLRAIAAIRYAIKTRLRYVILELYIAWLKHFVQIIILRWKLRLSEEAFHSPL